MVNPELGHDGTSMAGTGWVGSWMAAQQPVWDEHFSFPVGLPSVLENVSIRQFARLSLGGRRLRVVLSNTYGSVPVTVRAVSVARAHGPDRAVETDPLVVTFAGEPSVSIPPGTDRISDPVALPLSPLSTVATSLYLPDTVRPQSFHWDGRSTALIGDGQQTDRAAFPVAATTETRFLLARILVEAPEHQGCVVAFGDSITDGNGVPVNTETRWPDFLAARLQTDQVSVLNAGISGNRLLRDGMGQSGLTRFAGDVLSHEGVRRALVLLGINDIGMPGTPLAPDDPVVSAGELITGYQQLITQAHDRGVRVVGATLLPFEGALSDTPFAGFWSPAKEQVRQDVNHWIRTAQAFDAVVDFDRLLCDPARSFRLHPVSDSGDHLHPGPEGYRRMAGGVPVSDLLSE